MSFETKIRPYRVYEISWTSAPTDLAIELDGIANTFNVIEGPVDLSVRLNSTDNDLIEDASSISNMVIEEIYITSAIAIDTCKIYVAWEGQ
jgi:hypothetical protein